MSCSDDSSSSGWVGGKGGADSGSDADGAGHAGKDGSVEAGGNGGGSGPVDGSLDGKAEGGDSGGITAPAFDWVGIIGTGQSLSCGASGTPVVSTTQPFHNLKLDDSSPAPKYDGVGDKLSLVPLVAPLRPPDPNLPQTHYPNNIWGETPNEGMANQMSATSLALGGFELVSIHTNVGIGGQPMSVIKKDGTGNSYASSLYEAKAIQLLAQQAGKKLGYGAVILTHGESDFNNDTYDQEVYQLQKDYNADLKAITGQIANVPLILTQQSTFPFDSGSTAPSTLLAWKASVQHPGEVLCAGSKYQYDYSVDKVHLSAPQYRRLGEKYAEVYVRGVLSKQGWKPLQPNAAKLAGQLITVDFDVPDPPMAWEDTRPAPHQQAFTQWSKARGFEVLTQTELLTISSVSIAGNQVLIALAAPPPAGVDLYVGYAMVQDGQGASGGTPLGRGGQLRDSDSFEGYDGKTILCTVSPGSSTIKAVTPSDFAEISRTDVVSGDGLANLAVVASVSGDTIMLSEPYTKAAGTVALKFRHDHRNYAVQFLMNVTK